MPNFFQGLLITLMLFAFCFSLVIIIKLCFSWMKYKQEQLNTPPVQKQDESPKVYYVKESISQPKKKKRKRKSPDLALKGVVLTPEQFKVVKQEIEK